MDGDGRAGSRPEDPGAPRGGVGRPEAGARQEEQWDRVEVILAAVSRRWTLPVLRAIEEGASRPGDLLRAVNESRSARPRLGPKVMHEELNRMVDLGLIRREAAGGFPPQTDYFPTEAGRAILTDVGRLGARGGRTDPVDQDPVPPRDVDTAIPSPARVWNFLLGGKDNFASDRAVAAAAAEELPTVPVVARAVRLFQADCVRRLATELGVRQFLDIGTGLPVAGSVHEVAQGVAPECRIVYVDNDPLVLSHARALLTSAPQGACAYIDEDLRNPGSILAAAARTLDLSQPVAIMLIAVLHFIPDSDDPWGIVSRLLDGIPGGAYLVISHGASDLGPDELLMPKYNSRSPVPITMRTRDAVGRFFTGTQMLDPGLMSLARWWPHQPLGTDADLAGHVGIGWSGPAGPGG